ncbi:MAG: flagellar basal body P-ring formation protein FlgA [Burkholderiales bacterium]|nr:flagellar basal body P-ring formation protein FlgA [Burkholderiales bacterium]
MLATSGGLAQAAALANDTAVPVALVRGEEGGASLNVLPIPVAQVEAQVLEITRLHTQRALAGSVADAAAEAASDVGAPWTEVAGEPVTRRIQRVEVALGGADPRLKLAPCEKVQTYVPEGSRLWGKSRVGLRCEQGAVRWNVFVPVTVRVWGRGVIAVVPLRPGARLEAADLRVAEVDLAAESSNPVLDPDEAIGRVLIRGVQGGQSLRQSHLKPRRYFAAGDAVQIQIQGSGFAVSGEGVALTPGDEGQCARIRSGARVVCGRPVGDRQAVLML